MLRRINNNEIEIMLDTINFYKTMIKYYDEIKKIYKDGKICFNCFDTIDMLFAANDEFYGYESDSEEYQFFKILYPFKFFMSCFYYDEFYYNNLPNKYNDFNSKYPLKTQYVELCYDYESYKEDDSGESDFTNDGNAIYELAMYSDDIDSFLKLFYNDKEKMRVLVDKIAIIATNFCTSYHGRDSCYDTSSFCVIKTDDYKGKDRLVDELIENDNANEFVICFYIYLDGYSIAPKENFISNSEIGRDLLDYMKKEVDNYVRNYN